MYLFTRSGRLAPGQTRQSGAWAVAITEKVNQITDLSVRLWTPVFSPGVGTMVWSAVVEELAQLEAGEAKLMADDGYLDAVDEGAKYAAQGVEDSLASILYGTIDPDRPVEYLSVVSSILAPGALATGMAGAVEIAQRVEQVTGQPVIVAATTTGPYGGVEWISRLENVAALQKADQAIASDPEVVAMIDRIAPGAYQSGLGVTTQVVLRRVV